MKKLIQTLAMILVTATSGMSRAESPVDFAMAVQQRIWSNLETCGLSRLPAHSPLLPPPRIDADEAVVVPATMRVLAYSEYLIWGGYNYWMFKNPNGGQTHTTMVGNWSISFSTPMAGTVAHANEVATPAGRSWSFFCQSRRVAGRASFDTCVDRLYVNPIVNQLCRWVE